MNLPKFGTARVVELASSHKSVELLKVHDRIAKLIRISVVPMVKTQILQTLDDSGLLIEGIQIAEGNGRYPFVQGSGIDCEGGRAGVCWNGLP